MFLIFMISMWSSSYCSHSYQKEKSLHAENVGAALLLLSTFSPFIRSSHRMKTVIENSESSLLNPSSELIYKENTNLDDTTHKQISGFTQNLLLAKLTKTIKNSKCQGIVIWTFHLYFISEFLLEHFGAQKTSVPTKILLIIATEEMSSHNLKIVTKAKYVCEVPI
jgi:hypothetical protein